MEGADWLKIAGGTCDRRWICGPCVGRVEAIVYNCFAAGLRLAGMPGAACGGSRSELADTGASPVIPTHSPLRPGSRVPDDDMVLGAGGTNEEEDVAILAVVIVELL